MANVNTTEEKFGRPIQFKNSLKPAITSSNGSVKEAKANQIGANAMVSQFLNVKNNYKEDLLDLVGSDNHALRYFCANDCAFIFDVSFIEAIVNTIRRTGDGGKGVMILYQGLRKHPLDPDKAEKGCAFGRPTLIATAFAEQKDKAYKHEPIRREDFLIAKELTEETYDGIEHPGDGSGTKSLEELKEIDKSKDWTPIVVEKGKGDDDTDFIILDKLTEDQFKNWL